jgi:hypothetical protein
MAQCDLAGHSEWFAKCLVSHPPLGAQAAAARRELAERLRKIMTDPFALLAWMGDGGVFVADQSDSSCDEVVSRLRAMAMCFRDWQSAERWSKLDLERLGFRISAHTGGVWVDQEPGYWTSLDLNRFLKYERRIAHVGGITITRALFQSAEVVAGDFVEAPERLQFADRGDPWTLYFDKETTPAVAVRRDLSWYSEHFAATFAKSQHAEAQRLRLPNAFVLLVTTSVDDSISFDIRTKPAVGDPFAHYRSEAWTRQSDDLKSLLRSDAHAGAVVDNWKLSPVSIRLPLTDFPVLAVDCVQTRYIEARSFLTLVATDSAMRRTVEANDVTYMPDAPLRPGILVAHITLICQSDDSEQPLLVLAQRSTRQGSAIGFYGGTWSTSFEEQVQPGETTMVETVERGLKEEFLGDLADGVETTITAVFVDEGLLNLTAAALCRTNRTFGEVCAAWRSAVDRAEHSQLAALPLDRNLLRNLALEKAMTPAVQEALVRNPDEAEPFGSGQSWELHPTTGLRSILLLRLMDRDLLP